MGFMKRSRRVPGVVGVVGLLVLGLPACGPPSDGGGLLGGTTHEFFGSRREPADRFGASIAVGRGPGDRRWVAVGSPGEEPGVDGRVERPHDPATGLSKADGLVSIKYTSAAMGLSATEDFGGATVNFTGGSDSAFGEALAAGDFNCDGTDDLAIGAPLSGRGGAVSIAFGSLSDPFHLPVAPTQLLVQGFGLGGADESGDQAGSALAAGDFNGDGCDDLATGIPGEDVDGVANAGSISINTGSRSGLSSGWVALRLEQGGSGVPGSLEHGDAVGSVLQAVDVDRDGMDDLIVGIPLEDESDDVSDSGAVAVVRKPLNGGSAPGVVLAQSNRGLSGTREAADVVGSAVAAADFDRDGYVDIAIGAPGEDLGAGLVQVKYGPVMAWPSGRSEELRQGRSAALGDAAERSDHVGEGLSAADFDDDGDPDLAVGTPGEANVGSDCPGEGGDACREGRVSVVFSRGGRSTIGKPERVVQLFRGQGLPGALDPSESLGAGLIGDDVTGSSAADLLVPSAATDTDDLPDAGSLLLIDGGGSVIGAPVTEHAQGYAPDGVETYGLGAAGHPAGHLPVVVIVARSLNRPDYFAERPGGNGIISTFQTMLNNGTKIEEFYEEVSGGKLTMDVEGFYGPYPVSVDSNDCVNKKTGIHEAAIEAADAAGDIDLGDYDADGDGTVRGDELAIIVVQNCDGVDADNDGFADTVTAKNGIGANRPLRADTSPPFRGDAPIMEEGSSSMLVYHELFHSIEAVGGDLYGRRSDTCLGATGSPPSPPDAASCLGLSLMDSSYRPGEGLHLDPGPKMLVDWLDPRVIDLANLNQGLSLTLLPHRVPYQRNGRPVLLYDSSRGPNEYFLIESRSRRVTPNDDELDANGVVVWRYRRKGAGYARTTPIAPTNVLPSTTGPANRVFDASSGVFQLQWLDETSPPGLVPTSARFEVVSYDRTTGRAVLEVLP